MGGLGLRVPRNLRAHAVTLAGRLGRVTLDLRPGEVTALCGPNGAGKSSLLLCLAGLIRPNDGGVTIDGIALEGMAPRVRARSLGYLSQAGDVAWDMDVATLVGLGRLPWGGGGAPAVEAAMAAMDLEDLAGRRISTLSGGERARAMLARVLAGEPDWVLADEPLAHLDLRHAMALMAALRAQARAGRGVVVVMHDLAMAMNHADRVLVMAQGALVADGGPDEALGPDVLRGVWGVEARWLGEKEGRALAVMP
jgi:iron complex transport system ATP-binding protein